MLAKLQEVIFPELLDLVSALDLISVTAGFDREGVRYIKVTEYTQSGTVPLVPLVAKLTVIDLEVGRDVIQDHREALNNRLSSGVLVDRGITED